MRPGMQTLLDLLRGELNGPDVAAEEWMKVLDVAAEENILPWAASCLRAQPNRGAPEVDARLRAIDREAAKQNLRLSAIVEEIVKSVPFEMRRAEQAAPDSNQAALAVSRRAN